MPIYIINLGHTLYNLKRYENAEKEFREAIRINPNLAEAHNNLGILLKDLNRYDEAEKVFREVIRINPNYIDAYYGLGHLLKRLNRYDEAEKVFIDKRDIYEKLYGLDSEKNLFQDL
ncbi:MAG: hypothetical protein CVU81_02380 [Euryarchaeota archaeon HGW-Euryarchaeota-1]|nr:MAG: hypothetical protein CVU81_02380 [Euryarchaeota archaeon HGW-Euryarchaeota-1]